jgi:Uma2 family endonuclease
MSVAVPEPTVAGPRYNGLRMSADEYFALPDDGYRYELLDGVVIMTPAPTFGHQRVARELTLQLGKYLDEHPVGEMLYEVDIDLGPGPEGGDLVYRPEIVFYAGDRSKNEDKRLVGPPDLVIEVVSPLSRSYDKVTKRNDYQRCGVREYWIIDPAADEFTFLCNQDGSFIQMQPAGNSFASKVVEGFTLDLARVRAKFPGR